MKLRPSSWFHPVTQRRLARFRGLRRAWWSFWLLLGAYLLSLPAELLCNDKPLWIRFEGRHHFPIFRYTSERDLTGAGHDTRTDFKVFVRSERFRADPGRRIVWPPIPWGPREIIKPDSIALPDTVQVVCSPEPHLGTVQVAPDGAVSRGVAAGFFFGVADGGEEGLLLAAPESLPLVIQTALEQRFRNETAPAVSAAMTWGDAGSQVELSLPPYTPRATAPRTVRLTLRELMPATSVTRLDIARGQGLTGPPPAWWTALDPAQQEALLAWAAQRFERPVDPFSFSVGAVRFRATAQREEVRYPFRPVAGHPLGIDSAGRDVAARMFYGLRTSMTFGLLLTAATLLLGTGFGAVQGYYGGAVDLVGQRVVEIWDALPFLYILMLMGSIFGRSFLLLLACYGVFNWIGISYYMRAEFLRLRRQPFVEAARALGLPGWKIMLRHILPNALVPLITFFPFSLVSAIGTLAALDFLGFGLPPPTPSWGELLAQAQEYTWAWWLALYPSMALFLVMLLGVFIGEGVRQAFDPKPASRLE